MLPRHLGYPPPSDSSLPSQSITFVCGFSIRYLWRHFSIVYPAVLFRLFITEEANKPQALARRLAKFPHNLFASPISLLRLPCPEFSSVGTRDDSVKWLPRFHRYYNRDASRWLRGKSPAKESHDYRIYNSRVCELILAPSRALTCNLGRYVCVYECACVVGIMRISITTTRNGVEFHHLTLIAKTMITAGRFGFCIYKK